MTTLITKKLGKIWKQNQTHKNAWMPDKTEWTIYIAWLMKWYQKKGYRINWRDTKTKEDTEERDHEYVTSQLATRKRIHITQGSACHMNWYVLIGEDKMTTLQLGMQVRLVPKTSDENSTRR